MKVEQRKTADIKPYDKNPRDNDGAVEAVARSIREYGFRQPIVVDADGVIIVGHTRWKAAQKLGLEEVPVHVVTDLTPPQIKAYRIADNKVAELASWDMDLLPIELSELRGMDVDLESLGFSTEELEKMLGASGTEGMTDPDAIPEPPDAAVTQPGDIWVLGNHRLMCGDSGKDADVDRLLDGARIQLVNTDPPYNVKVAPRSNNAVAAAQASGEYMGQQGMDAAIRGVHAHATHEKLRPKDRPLANDFVSDEEFARLLRAWFGNIRRVLDDGRSFYIWGGYTNIWNYPNALKESELYFSQMIIWVKEHPVLTRKDFMGNHEWCQPPETKVLTPAGEVPIASLRDGDRVISFNRSSSAIVGRRAGFAVRTTSRPYAGELYGVVAGGRTTWATDGHLFSVKLVPEARALWCVYLMRRGRWWRAGKTKLLTSWGLGIKQRLDMEKGEEAWILSVHETNAEAMCAEQVVATRYGIPTTFWREYANSARTDAQIRRIYNQIDLLSLQRSALWALTDHHRRLAYPFVTRGQTRAKHGRRVPFMVRACNLLPGAMAIPVPGADSRDFAWAPVRALDVQGYEGPVHSLDVEPHHHYIADGLVTHNCFYGWKEGAAHYFNPEITNATDVWSVKKVNPQSMVHLTEKPVELAERAMIYSSKPGENVLDLFGGSGSTLIAAEKTGRRSYLMEIDPLYCDVICKRWEAFTGKKAERIVAEVTP